MSEELITDAEARAEAAGDWGRTVHQMPRAVLAPKSAADIAKLLRTAGARHQAVAARGRGHSGNGQAQVADGVVVDMRTLATVHRVESDRVVVDAGASWLDVLTATLPHGLTPPVLTDYLGLSVGGTLSAGGIGGTSHRYGVQTDTVAELEVITADGATHRCGPDREPELYHAMLAGLGQCGIITRATVRLVPAPERAVRIKLYFPDAAALTAAQRKVLRYNRFDYLEGQILAGGEESTGWRYMLEAASYYTPPERPDVASLIADLAHLAGTEEFEDLPYPAFADRLGPGEEFLRGTGHWQAPHPWWNAFLPDSATDEFVGRLAAELVPEDLGMPGCVLVYPIRTDRLGTRLFRVPDEPVVFLVAVLRFALGADDAAVRRMIDANRDWFDRAGAVGGISYPIGTIEYHPADWRPHFGPRWPEFEAAKRRYDPNGILTPGQRIF